MKFRTSFQVPRSESKDNGTRPATAIHWKIPSLREKQSKPSGMNNTTTSKDDTGKKDELSLASPSTGTQEQEDPMGSPEPAKEPAPVEVDGANDDANKGQEQQLKRSMTRKKAIDGWKKFGAQLKTQSASLRARGQKYSEGIRGSKKDKVVRCGILKLL